MKLKTVGLSMIVLLSVIIFGCGSELSPTKENSEELLSQKDIVTALEEAGVDLESSSEEKSLSELVWNGKTPGIYSLKNSEGKIFIYIFDSISLRLKVFNRWGFVWQRDKFPGYFKNIKGGPLAYPAKNALVVCHVNHEKIGDNNLLEKVQRVIFYELNGGKEIVFKGEGNYWEGIVTLKYYEYFYEDEEGTTRYENYNFEDMELRYKGKNPDSVGTIKYVFENMSGSSFAEGVKLGKDGYIRQKSSGNGMRPYEDNPYTVTVEWNGKSETFQLYSQVSE